MKTILYIIIALLMFPSLALGVEHSTASANILEKAKSECASFESGEFEASDDAITFYDLTGDGSPEEVIDASQFACSTAASLWNGSGGTYLWVIVDNKPYEFLAHRWRVVDVDGQKVLLLAVHSSECSDDIGPCYRAFVWQDGFRTTTRAYE
jgi:hypothetical protein